LGEIVEMHLVAQDGSASWIRTWSRCEKNFIDELRLSFTIQPASIS
jgi:hypothetical protein